MPTIELPLGGMYASGNPAKIPDGATVLMENMISPAPGQWEKRPPIIEDLNQAAIGMALWDDRDNQVQRLIGFVANGSNTDLYVKAASGETYGSAVTGTNVTGGLTSYANYRGVLYYCIGSAVSTTATPAGIFSYNGSTVRTNPLGGESLYSLCVTPFGDRLMLAYVKASVTNQISLPYDATGWTQSNTTSENISSSDTITGRVTPTATTFAQIYLAGVYTVAASTTDTHLVFRSDLRNTSPSYELPMTTEIYYSHAWTADTVMAAGTIRVPTSLNGFRYRVKSVAGDLKTAPVTEPTWPTDIGDEVVDDQVTWICDGLDAIGSRPITLPALTDESEWITTWCVGTVPPNPSGSLVGVRIKFGTPAQPEIELTAVDVSLEDGRTNGDKNKANRGQQLTVGRFLYPFFNQYPGGGGGAAATLDLDNDIYWTETSDPNTITGDNFFFLRDLPGKVTAACTASGRYIVFKKRGMWVFQLTADPENPLQLERFYGDVGCVGPHAVTVFEDRVYFIGEDEVYEFSPGGEPIPLCRDGMRAEVFGSSGSVADQPSIAVNPLRRDLYMNYRVGSNTFAPFYVYQLDRKEWSKQRATSAGGLFGAPSVGQFLWNPTTRKIYLVYATTTLAARKFTYLESTDDPAAQLQDTGSRNIESYITFRPVETFFPRKEISIDGVGVYHSVTGSQASNTFEVQVSLDGGLTFPKFNRVTIPILTDDAAADRFYVPLRQLSQRGIVRLYHTGLGSKFAFNVSAVDVDIRIIGPQRNLSTPTQGSATL